MALLRFAGIARSTFYYYLKKMIRTDKYEEVKTVIKEIYHYNKGRYGYRRITLELRNQGYHLNHKTVLKLMNECGIKCQVRIRKYKSYKGEIGNIASNILQRDLRQKNLIRNGLLMLQSSHSMELSYTSLQYSTCIMVRSSVIIYQKDRRFSKQWICLIKHLKKYQITQI